MERWALHRLGQTSVWGLPGEEIEAPWVLSCSDEHHKRVFWGDALLPKMKAGGRKFPSCSKEVPSNTAFVCKDVRGAHRAALVPSSLPSSDGNGA